MIGAPLQPLRFDPARFDPPVEAQGARSQSRSRSAILAAPGGGPIFSWTFPLPPIDPLLVLARFARPDRPSFFFEKADQDESAVAFGSVWSASASGSGRFEQLRQAIAQAWELALGDRAGEPNLATRLWCAIPFFDQSSDPNADPSTDPSTDPNANATEPTAPNAHSPQPAGVADPTRWTALAATLCLPQWQVARVAGRTQLTVYWRADRQAMGYTTEGNWAAEWQRGQRQAEALRRSLLRLYDHPSPLERSAPRLVAIGPSSDHFSRAARRAIDQIALGNLTKIVLADTIDLTAAQAFAPAALLHNLRQRYAGCYLFAVARGDGRTFLGASPECLVRVAHGQAFADALAGSAPRGDNAEDDRLWGDRLLRSVKDRHEHSLVVNFLRDRLAALGATVETSTSPTLRKLANIQHLHTPITAQLPNHLDPLAVVAALHPTPAVAGLPTAAAMTTIAQLEPFDRGLYAGAIGWLDQAGQAEFAVGIRSALIQGDRARLYAGAGIVAGSDPEHERAEVQLKLRALLSALV